MKLTGNNTIDDLVKVMAELDVKQTDILPMVFVTSAGQCIHVSMYVDQVKQAGLDNENQQDHTGTN